MATPVPVIKKSPSPRSSPSRSSGSYTSSSEGGSPPAGAMPSDLEYSSHNDLRSTSREFTRDRDLRMKRYKPKASPTTAVHPFTQPTYEETSSTPSKKHKKKGQEKVVKVKKREDRRKSESVLETPAESTLKPEDKRPRHRRASSSQKEKGERPLSAGNTPETTEENGKPWSPGLDHRRFKTHHQHTQYTVDEGKYERTDDLEAKMAEAALYEKLSAESRGGRMTRGLEEIDRRARERRREEALRGVVEGAVEKFEGGEGKR